MNLDEAKENIQPLASGRNINRLETALNAEAHESGQAELLLERRRYEEAIHTYAGDDPLSPWYEYVLWVEQSYPKSGKQSALDEVVEKCLLKFEADSRYNQDPRLVKLFIKYLDSQPNPTEHFQTLYNSGIGTMVADLYIFWAYLYDVADNFEKAEYVFQKGRDAKAEPRDALEQAHRQFGFSMSQRLLHKDRYRENFLSTMEERRNALTSLRTHRQQVGSVRTGAAIKSHAPGRVDQNHRPGIGNQRSMSRERVSIFVDGASGYQPAPQAVASKSIVQLIMDSSRKQENLREPGPWSKAGAKQSTAMFSPSQASMPSFPILEDMELDSNDVREPIPMSISENNYAKPIKLPVGFVSHNEPLTPFPTLFFIEEPIADNAFPAYDKCMVFPKPEQSFSIEELGAYRWFKNRRISNTFTKEQDLVWANDPSVGIRLYPQYAVENDSQEDWITERFIPDEIIEQGKARFAFDIETIYPKESTKELTLEDRLFAKFQRGEMAHQQIKPEPEPEIKQTLFEATSMDLMDETMPVQGRQSIAKGAIRKSVVPGGRKSIFPMPEDRSRRSIATHALIPQSQDQTSKNVESSQSPLIDRVIHPIVEEESFSAAPDTEPIVEIPRTNNPNPIVPALSSFAIFEDPDPPKEKNLFKAPIAPDECPLPTRLPLTTKMVAREPEEPPLPPIEPEEAAGGTATGSYQNPNETCFSTQQFMFFIKAQSVSTPKANKQRKENVDITSPTAYVSATSAVIEPTPEFVSPPTAVTTTETPETMDVAQAVADISPSQPARQLSTIMETTESTTQMSSSSERESDSTSKTISRPAGFFPHKTIQPVTNLSVVAEHPSLSSTSIDLPPTSDFPIYRDATTEMPVIKVSTNRVTFNTNQPSVLTDRLAPKFVPFTAPGSAPQSTEVNPDLPLEKERSTVAKPTNVSLPVFEMGDDRTDTIPTPHTLASKSIFDVSKAMPSLPVPDVSIASLSVMSIREGNTGQMPVVKAATEIKVLHPFSDRKPCFSEQTTKTQPSLELTTQPQPVFEQSIGTMSFFQDHTTGKLPCINFSNATNPTQIDRPFVISEPVTLQKPFVISEPMTLTNTMPFDASTASMSSMSLLQEMPSTNNRQPVIKFAVPPETTGLSLTVKDPLSAKKRNNPDDDFLDMFTKTPDKSLKHCKNTTLGATGSSSKTGASRIPVPSSYKSVVKSFALMPQFDQASIHIKSEPLDEIGAASVIGQVSFDISSFELMSTSDTPKNLGVATDSSSNNHNYQGLANQSIHYKNPVPEFAPNTYETWSELSVLTPSDDVEYVEPVVDLDETRQVIESHFKNPNVNPFDDEVKAAFLEHCYFVDYMKSLDTCVMVNKLKPIYPKSRLDIGDRTFDVLALIGQGNFGHIFSSKCKTTSEMFALKQQRPANLWEFYICLEITSRMNDFPNMIDAFMPVNYALIGNNASILVSPYMKYGSLLSVCNKIRQNTSKNIAEPVVMLLAMQMLLIVDHLHACKIIHADIKPDNILLMKRLSYDHHDISIQLIDFGQAIDMQLYPENQTFRAKITTKNFVCTEMMNDKPWSYQTDLFCLAATFHTLLFGTDMIVCKAALGYRLSNNIPRYFCRDIWDTIFQTLINIKDCRTMPNLQSLRQILLQEVSDKKNATVQAISRFNSILDQK